MCMERIKRNKYVLEIKLFSTKPSLTRTIKEKIQMYHVCPPEGLIVVVSPFSRARPLAAGISSFEG